jgi:hypothetical protein
MIRYSWTSAFVAAIEEHDRVKLQKRIGAATRVMRQRSSALLAHGMTNRERDEFRRLCDARRALDLLHRVSNDVDLFTPDEQPKSA